MSQFIHTIAQRHPGQGLSRKLYVSDEMSQYRQKKAERDQIGRGYISNHTFTLRNDPDYRQWNRDEKVIEKMQDEAAKQGLHKLLVFGNRYKVSSRGYNRPTSDMNRKQAAVRAYMDYDDSDNELYRQRRMEKFHRQYYDAVRPHSIVSQGSKTAFRNKFKKGVKNQPQGFRLPLGGLFRR